MLIYDDELLKKENISYEITTKEFNENNEKIINLKEKIEKEIININNSYDIVYNDISKSFVAKHEKLYKEEKDLIEKLQNEVTKVEEKLENFLSECNNFIKIGEIINTGVKKLENNKEKNILKNLNYISVISKNQKKMNIFICQLMKNIKIKFEEDNANIKFEDYYFNGIPSPENIIIKNITSSSFEITWNIDETNIIGIDKNKINFIIELRKENQEFKQIYEGNKTSYIINDDLTQETNYEIRLCSSYNNINRPWSQILKVKTLKGIIFNNESLIIGNNKEYNNILKNWINPYKEIKAELLYRLTRDGDLYQTFHDKCDNKGPTLTLINDDSGLKTGGYTPLSWDSNTQWKYDNDTFIFNLTNKKKFIKQDNNNSVSIYCLHSYGPWFDNYGFESGHNMREYKFQYGNAFINANEIIPNENKEKYFKVNEVEVYAITFNQLKL